MTDLWVTTMPSRITWVVAILRIIGPGLVDDLDVPADPRVLVDDGPFDRRNRPDAEVGTVEPLVLVQLLGMLQKIDAHDIGIADRDVLGDAGRTPITEFSMTEPRPMIEPSQIRLFLTVAPAIREQGR